MCKKEQKLKKYNCNIIEIMFSFSSSFPMCSEIKNKTQDNDLLVLDSFIAMALLENLYLESFSKDCIVYNFGKFPFLSDSHYFLERKEYQSNYDHFNIENDIHTGKVIQNIHYLMRSNDVIKNTIVKLLEEKLKLNNNSGKITIDEHTKSIMFNVNNPSFEKQTLMFNNISINEQDLLFKFYSVTAMNYIHTINTNTPPDYIIDYHNMERPKEEYYTINIKSNYCIPEQTEYSKYVDIKVNNEEFKDYIIEKISGANYYIHFPTTMFNKVETFSVKILNSVEKKYIIQK